MELKLKTIGFEIQYGPLFKSKLTKPKNNAGYLQIKVV
jgi:hypothetical protein